jgi:hypothetical protein
VSFVLQNKYMKPALEILSKSKHRAKLEVLGLKEEGRLRKVRIER